jgi:hypothetical protein
MPEENHIPIKKSRSFRDCFRKPLYKHGILCRLQTRLCRRCLPGGWEIRSRRFLSLPEDYLVFSTILTQPLNIFSTFALYTCLRTAKFRRLLGGVCFAEESNLASGGDFDEKDSHRGRCRSMRNCIIDLVSCSCRASGISAIPAPLRKQ